MEHLWYIAIDSDIPLELRYETVRQMQSMKHRKVPKWKARVLKHILIEAR